MSNRPKLQGKVEESRISIKTRMFWTWDHSTEWMLNHPGAQTMGASNDYLREVDMFVEDYTKLLEWCGCHNIDAVVVWGLLRDTHGGVESVKQLCDVASKNGVRLMCGVGLNAYGGVYYDGESPYNLKKHLQAHPELYAIDLAGNKLIRSFGVSGPKLSHHACPSRRENQEFAIESLQWLFKELPLLGGVQIETGDTGVCQCKQCRERRQYPISSFSSKGIELAFSWEDMALMYPMAAKAVRSVAPDAWICCETYSHPEPFIAEPGKIAGGVAAGKPTWADECLAKFPEDVFVQWICDEYTKPLSAKQWTEAGTVSNERYRNLMRGHFSTYWYGLRGELAIDWIADMVQQSIAHGFDAICLFGENSPFHTGAELNYLALENYGSAVNPGADVNMFLRDVAAPLLGGEKDAHDYLKYARLLSNRDRIPDALKDIHIRCGKLPPAVARRWTWLANYLASFVYTET